jgi:hypothetical protein
MKDVITTTIDPVKRLNEATGKLVFTGSIATMLNKPLDQGVTKDALTVSSFLAARTVLYKNSESISEETIQDISYFIANPPDAIVIMGNNDLQQVERVANIYQELQKHGCAPKKIYISGKGGHGTVPGAIFSYTEAQTMAVYLIQCGVPANSIVEERNATNSGANVKLVTELMLAHDAECYNKQPAFKHIFISGTPNGILRQLKTFEKQSNYAWEKLSTFPPNGKELEEQYYSENYANTDSVLNFVCALRELANFMKYAVATDFMSARPVENLGQLQAAIAVMVKYYNHGAKENIDPAQLYAEYITVCENKRNGKAEDNAKLIEKLNKIFGYFSGLFNKCEEYWMQHLPADISFNEQADILNKQELIRLLNELVRAVAINKPSGKTQFFAHKTQANPVPVNENRISKPDNMLDQNPARVDYRAPIAVLS